jgi:SAM-dependent methyltransferase
MRHVTELATPGLQLHLPKAGQKAPLMTSLRSTLRRWNYDIRVRYTAVAVEIRRANPERDWSILDVGCGTTGIAPFLPRWSVTGLDEGPSVSEALAERVLRGSALLLPFRDRSWDVVTCVDVLEHLSPTERLVALHELLRVVRRLLIVAHPAGEQARLADERFRSAYSRTPDAVPEWLREHLGHTYPKEDLVPCFLRAHCRESEAAVRTFGNEPLWLQRSHRMMARHSRVLYAAWSVTCSLLTPMLGRPLPRGQGYRSVTVLRRT